MVSMIDNKAILELAKKLSNGKNQCHIFLENKKGNITQNSKYVFIPCMCYNKNKSCSGVRIIPENIFMDPKKMNKEGKLLCKDCRRRRGSSKYNGFTFKYGKCCSNKIELLEKFEGAYVCGMCI